MALNDFFEIMKQGTSARGRQIPKGFQDGGRTTSRSQSQCAAAAVLFSIMRSPSVCPLASASMFAWVSLCDSCRTAPIELRTVDSRRARRERTPTALDCAQLLSLRSTGGHLGHEAGGGEGCADAPLIIDHQIETEIEFKDVYFVKIERNQTQRYITNNYY